MNKTELAESLHTILTGADKEINQVLEQFAKLLGVTVLDAKNGRIDIMLGDDAFHINIVEFKR